jgi:hypothetical protein
LDECFKLRLVNFNRHGLPPCLGVFAMAVLRRAAG